MNKKNTPKNLLHWRKEIDSCNKKIIDLLKQRSSYVLEVGEIKSSNNDTNFYIPDRETYILNSLCDYNKEVDSPLSSQDINAIFRQIISSSLNLEKTMKVGYLGPEGSYTNIATRLCFGLAPSFVSCSDIKNVFSLVAKKKVDCAVIPVENSTAGIVGQTISMFNNSDYDNIEICNELHMPISHSLITKKNIEFKKITHILAHSQALNQCRDWIEANCSHCDLIETSSNSKAVIDLDKYANAAAIAHKTTADTYNAFVQKEGIEDSQDNTTRFFVIRHKNSEKENNSLVAIDTQIKSSIIIHSKSSPGLLAKILSPFYKNKIDCINIHSYPAKNDAWSYYFYLEFYGDMQNTTVEKTLAEIEGICGVTIKLLGSYTISPKLEGSILL